MASAGDMPAPLPPRSGVGMDVESEGGTTRPNDGAGEGSEQPAAATKYTQQDLEEELKSLIFTLHALGITLEDSAPNEEYYFSKINKLVEHYQKVHSMRDAVDGMVPVALIQDYLDKGLNPELYTKKRLEVAEALQQQNKGRIDSLKLLRDNVQSEIQRRLGPPAEVTFYAANEDGTYTAPSGANGVASSEAAAS